MLKTVFKLLLQNVLGFSNYLFLFAIYTVRRLANNQHEKEFNYFLNNIPENGTVLDIGANIGIMTTALARKVKTGQVFSFEPMPDNIKALKRIVGYFKVKNVKLFTNALGDKMGELTMVLPIMNKMKMQGLSHVKEEGDTSEWNNGREVTVPVKTLDSIPELIALKKIDAIKIDVENYEYYVLKGGEQLLRKHMPIIYCELWKNEKRQMCFEYLESLGYTTNVLIDDKLVPYKDQEDETNFFFNK
ncbi:MAG: FkbM family methyltransferase [Taibaiella sp.]|nr:FkbM family methyltransferase [Taibaiella sp.]